MKLNRAELINTVVGKLTQHKENGVFIAYSMGAAEQFLKVRDTLLDQVDFAELYTVDDLAKEVVMNDIHNWFGEDMVSCSLTTMDAALIVDNVIQPTSTEEFETNLKAFKSMAGQLPKTVAIIIDLTAEAILEIKGIYLPK